MSQATNTTAPEAAIAPAVAAPTTNLTAEQVMRILTSRKIVDSSMVGLVIDKGLRIVGRGNATKDETNPRIVYNTNAMRRAAMAEAAAHVRGAQACLAIDDQEGAQEAFRLALNVGVLTFSLPADWQQFGANAMITASVEEFVIKTGTDAGKKGLGLGNVRLVPGVTVKSEADAWTELLGAPAADTSAPTDANVIV